jgi:hypothetical protein
MLTPFRMKTQLLLGTIFFFICSSFSIAWDTPGHEQISDMAYTLLTDATKLKIRNILNHGDPQYIPIDQTDDALRDAFRRAASFPDRLKSDTHTAYEAIVIEMNRKWQPNVDPNATGELIRCKTWHYYDTPIRFHGPKPDVRTSNALVVYNFAAQRLSELKTSGTASDLKEAAWWLYWIEHLTGDLHQPLHCTSNFGTVQGGDAGANLFHIKVPDEKNPGHTKSITLHSYWDEGIDHATNRHLRFDEDLPSDDAKQITNTWLADAAFQPSATDAADLDISHWIAKGAVLADTVVYNGISEGKSPTESYATKQIDLCKHLAVLASRRLGAVLNAALAP